MAGRPSGYSGLQIGLHWAVAVLVALQYLASDGIEHAWRAFRRGQEAPADDVSFVWLHIISGVLILLFALWRLALRFTRGVPALPQDDPAPLRWLAHLTHAGIYLLLVLMPLSGAAAWFGGIVPAAQVHVTAKLVLLALVGLHVLGAVVQQLFMGTGVMMRMMAPER